ncbi:MAG: Uma2 family endonuclease [Oscillospiraceae bacterium]|nr:Uma2 family endonuclease [Oscillospiraceae bacterium]
MDSNLAWREEPWEELIGGVPVAMSPRPRVDHNRISGNIYHLFRNYLKGKRCEAFPDGVDLYLTEQDRFIPDGMIVCDPDKVRIDGVHGAPDLVVEVLSPGTARYDRGRKKDVYEKSGVREYWIVEPAGKSLEQYILTDGRLELREVYAIYPQWMLDKMKPQERESVATSFRCSLYDDLTISLEDVFDRVT